MRDHPTSLSAHILNEQALHPEATGEFSLIMVQIALAGKVIASELRRAGLTGALGSTGQTNVQGEEVQKLDERANEIFLSVFKSNELVRTLVSEEMAQPYEVPDARRRGNYVIYLDPLDGSSNIDVNAPLGSIFSIHRLQNNAGAVSEAELLKPGSEQVGAGYLLYGAGTNLVYTCGRGVHLFALDQDVGEFFLSAHDVAMPARGYIYSVNEGNYAKWPSGVQRYIDDVKEVDTETRRPYAGRYTGCLVADVHRVLLKGGIYLYPGEVAKPEGKLRLMYEAAPLTLIVQQAGGSGSTGTESVLTVQPSALHQRVPLFIGSRENVSEVEQSLRA